MAPENKKECVPAKAKPISISQGISFKPRTVAKATASKNATRLGADEPIAKKSRFSAAAPSMSTSTSAFSIDKTEVVERRSSETVGSQVVLQVHNVGGTVRLQSKKIISSLEGNVASDSGIEGAEQAPRVDEKGNPMVPDLFSGRLHRRA